MALTSHDGTGVDGVDSGSLGQLASPCACHGLNSSLRATIDTLLAEATASTDTANIDNAATAVGGQVRDSSLHEEQRASDIDTVDKVKVLGIALLNRKVRCHTSIVDDDVDLQFAGLGVGKVVQCCGDEVCRTVLAAHVCLYGQCLDSMLFLEALGQFLGDGFGRVGGVVHDQRTALGGEVLACCGTDT